MEQTTRKRVSNHKHAKETKVRKVTQDSQDDLINNEKNNSSSESDLFQERRNMPFVSVYTDQVLPDDPLQLYSGSQDDSQIHMNSDRDNSESDVENSEQCNVTESIDSNELEDIQQIRQWVINCRIPHEHVDKLLKILKVRLLPTIPLSTEALLRLHEPDSSGTIKNNNHKKLDMSTPVIDASNVQCKSNFEAFVLAQLASQQSSMQRIENKLDNFANVLLAKKVCSSAKTDIDFKAKYNLSFPINEKHLFMIFDEMLKTDKFLKNDVCLELNNHIDKDYSTSKSFLSMIRAFITKNVAMQYTASRHSKENAKDIFKNTQFYECMENVFLAARNKTSLPTYTSSELMSSLSDVLSNAKKWNEKKISS